MTDFFYQYKHYLAIISFIIAGIFYLRHTSGMGALEMLKDALSEERPNDLNSILMIVFVFFAFFLLMV